MAKVRKPARPSSKPAAPAIPRLYTLEVFLISGPVSPAFSRKNRVVSRTLQIRGDQTLADLHQAVFAAFDRWEQHMYEFQFGKRPMDPEGPRYTLPGAFESASDGILPPAGRVTDTTLDSLGLKVGQRFGYWFDFGDDWWHQVNVVDIQDAVPQGKYPKVVKRVGASPPQYAQEDADPEEEDEPQELQGAAAADAACLVGEMHLNKGDYDKAVEAFTRAITNHPTADAYQGRARAYRALAEQDERQAEALR
jgi:tetratricopeptide (TPR) repeat protein